MFFLCMALAVTGFLLLLLAAVVPIDLLRPADVAWFYTRLLIPLALMLTGMLLAEKTGKPGRMVEIWAENEQNKRAPSASEGIPDPAECRNSSCIR